MNLLGEKKTWPRAARFRGKEYSGWRLERFECRIEQCLIGFRETIGLVRLKVEFTEFLFFLLFLLACCLCCFLGCSSDWDSLERVLQAIGSIFVPLMHI